MRVDVVCFHVVTVDEAVSLGVCVHATVVLETLPVEIFPESSV